MRPVVSGFQEKHHNERKGLNDGMLQWYAAVFFLVFCLYVHLCLIFDSDVHDVRLSVPHIQHHSDNFVIVQFSDLHFGESELKDANSTEVMRTILTSEQNIDLVVFSGDQVSGWVAENPSKVLTDLTNALDAVRSLGLRYATIFGNHDDQTNMFSPDTWFDRMKLISFFLFFALFLAIFFRKTNRMWGYISTLLLTSIVIMYIVRPSKHARTVMQAFESNLGLSSSKQGPSSVHGVSNYYIPVKFVNQTVLFFFIDSGGGRLLQKFYDDQVYWINHVANIFSYPISLAFAHIPLPEYAAVANGPNCFGEIGESSSRVETEHQSLYECLDNIGTKALFVGHDHDNSWCCKGSPALCYGRHTGYGGYGTKIRGARVIRLQVNSNVLITTWLRLQDGSVQDQGILYSSNDPV